IRQPEVDRLKALYNSSENPHRLLALLKEAALRKNQDIENARRLLKALGETEGITWAPTGPRGTLADILIANVITCKTSRQRVSDEVIALTIHELGRLGSKGSEDAIRSLGHFAQESDDRNFKGGVRIGGLSKLHLIKLQNHDDPKIRDMALREIGQLSVDSLYSEVPSGLDSNIKVWTPYQH
ncbi:MAG: hypothetical protein ABIF01_05225, partial [Candidatus Micrarchaeota archaeon]